MSTSIFWALTCGGLVSRSGGVKDSHPLNITETEVKRRLHGLRGLKRFSLLLQWNSPQTRLAFLNLIDYVLLVFT